MSLSPGPLRYRRRTRRSPHPAAAGKKSAVSGPLQTGHKLHLDVSSRGGIVFVQRKRTFCETLIMGGEKFRAVNEVSQRFFTIFGEAPV